ncbi:MAG: alpha/beta fold hydrolase [Rhodospirillales bacterium]|nr:alpha/beta fold hydrolase [Rhodospirillales bacterium]
MRQEDWVIETGDGHKIYGITDFADDSKKSEKCLCLVHGLTGGADEYILKTAANFFRDRGYDVIRFNLYYWEKSARRLSECTLQTHAADLNRVLEAKAAGYQKIFLSGHSYGGPTIMIAQPKQVTALSLWDPTFDFPRLFNDGDFFKEMNGLKLLNGGCETLVNDAFIEEATTRYGIEESLALSEALSAVPIQVIAAAGRDAIFAKDQYSWHSKGHPLNERQFVEGADHCFHRGNSLDELLGLAYHWFERS